MCSKGEMLHDSIITVDGDRWLPGLLCDHIMRYVNVESYCAPETHMTFYVYYTSVKKIPSDRNHRTHPRASNPQPKEEGAMLCFFLLPHSCSYFLTFCLGIPSSGLKNHLPLAPEGGSWGLSGEAANRESFSGHGFLGDVHLILRSLLLRSSSTQLQPRRAGEAGPPVEVQSMGLCILKGQLVQCPRSNY